MPDLDISALKPLNVSGLKSLKQSSLDTSSLKKLDVSGLKPLSGVEEKPGWLSRVGGNISDVFKENYSAVKEGGKQALTSTDLPPDQMNDAVVRGGVKALGGVGGMITSPVEGLARERAKAILLNPNSTPEQKDAANRIAGNLTNIAAIGLGGKIPKAGEAAKVADVKPAAQEMKALPAPARDGFVVDRAGNAIPAKPSATARQVYEPQASVIPKLDISKLKPIESSGNFLEAPKGALRSEIANKDTITLARALRQVAKDPANPTAEEMTRIKTVMKDQKSGSTPPTPQGNNSGPADLSKIFVPERTPISTRQFLYNKGKELSNTIKSAVDPKSMSDSAKYTTGVIREAGAKRTQRRMEMENNLNKFEKNILSLPLEERYGFVHAYETGQVNKLPEYLKPAAKALQEEYDKAYDTAQFANEDKKINYIENYMGHMYENPEEAGPKLMQLYKGNKSLEGSKRFTKQRVLPTIQDAIKLGLKPITDNPIEWAKQSIGVMNHYAEGQEIIEDLKKSGDVKPIAGKPIPPEAAKINDKIGAYYAPRPIAKIINNHLSPGASGNSLYRGLRSLSSMGNIVRLSASAFHVINTGLMSAASEVNTGMRNVLAGIGTASGERIARGGKQVLTGATIIPAWVKHQMLGEKMLKSLFGKSTNPEMAAIRKAYIQGGGRFQQGKSYRASGLGSYGEAIGRGTAVLQSKEMLHEHGPIIGAAKIATRMLDTASAPVMNVWVPRLKAGATMSKMADELKNHGPISSAAEARELFGKVVDNMDDRFGQMVDDNLFWNKTAKDMMRLMLAFPTWLYGNARAVGGGARDWAESAKKLFKEGKVDVSDRALFPFSYTLTLGLAGATYQYMMTGKGPEEPKDYFYPKTGGVDSYGNPERAALPSVASFGVGMATDPQQYLSYQFQPWINTAMDTWHNSDWRGDPIFNTNDPLYKRALDIGESMTKGYEPFIATKPSGYNPTETKIDGIQRFAGIRQAPSKFENPNYDTYKKKNMEKREKKKERYQRKQEAKEYGGAR